MRRCRNGQETDGILRRRGRVPRRQSPMATEEDHWTGGGCLGREKQPGPGSPWQEGGRGPGNKNSPTSQPAPRLSFCRRGPLVKSMQPPEASLSGLRAEWRSPKGGSGGANRLAQHTRSLRWAGQRCQQGRSVLRPWSPKDLWHSAVGVVSHRRTPGSSSCHERTRSLLLISF